MFNLTTHHRDKKGNIIKHDPYVLVIENGVKKFERPPGSGVWYAENGELLNPIVEKKPAAPEITDEKMNSLVADLGELGQDNSVKASKKK